MNSYKPTIHVAIADDHALFRDGIKMIVESRDNFQCVLEADNGLSLLDEISKSSKRPDVILLDLRMPVMDGLETTKRLREEYPRIKILILTGLDQDDYILHLLDLGASGYLLKNSSAEEVQRAIQTVYDRDYYFSKHVSQVMLSGLHRHRRSARVSSVTSRITEREEEVLQLMCDQMSATSIADRLSTSEDAVHQHCKDVLRKLNANGVPPLD